MKGKLGVILGVHHVDSRYHVVGMKGAKAPDISLGLTGEARSADCLLHPSR
jgi:hypothetical protein